MKLAISVLVASSLWLGASPSLGSPAERTALTEPTVPAQGDHADRERTAPGRPFTLMQMNTCLSGLAGCYPRTEYPAVVDEAIRRIKSNKADAVTLNEACSGDVDRIATETGYEARFATVIYRGAPLPCTNPDGRGVFGNAVLTKDRVVTSADAAYVAQSGVEQRRYICVTTTKHVTACTSHLSTGGSAEQVAANDAQCRELSAVLVGYAAQGPTIFGGDVNRRESCAPDGFWTITDAAATQAPGIQHAYGTADTFKQPTPEIEPATYTDHDVLLVRSRLQPPPLG